MKIAIIGLRGIPSGYSGYETFAQEVGPRLVKRGHEVTVYCRKSLFSERPTNWNGVKLVYLPSIQTKSLSTFSHTFLASLHVAVMRRVDVAIYVNVANSMFCVIPKIAGIKTALNVDGMEWLRPKWGPTGKKFFLVSAKICKYTTSKVVTDAPRMQEIYKEQFHVDSVDIAYGANLYSSSDPSRVKELGITPGKYFFTACRLIPDNNVDLLVDAFKNVKGDYEYVVVGDTPYYSEYAERVRSCTDKRIHFLGHIDDQSLMDELYANAFAYLHAHEYGGTNPTLLRALAGGNCVLALSTPFNHGVMRDAGMYFDKNVASITQAVQCLCDKPEQAELYAIKAQDRIQESFTWDQITDQYEALCRDLRPQR